MASDRSQRQQQTDHYRRTASRYDRTVWSLGCRDNRNHATKITAISRALGLQRGGLVLEVGAGTGLHARWIADQTPSHYVGLDLSEQMLAIARERLGPGGRLGIGDALTLPFADATFDAAFCAGTLHHLPSAAAGLRELARVTKPGGRVAALEPNWKFPSVLIYSAFTPAEHNTFRINERRLIGWASAAGLDRVRLERLLYTPPSPRSWIPAYDKIDAAMARTPGLRNLSINLLVAGTRSS